MCVPYAGDVERLSGTDCHKQSSAAHSGLEDKSNSIVSLTLVVPGDLTSREHFLINKLEMARWNETGSKLMKPISIRHLLSSTERARVPVTTCGLSKPTLVMSIVSAQVV